MNTGALMEGMKRIGYSAVNLGEREVLFGYDRLQPTAGKQKGVPFLSANLVYQDSAAPIAQRTLVQTVEIQQAGGRKRKVRIGILGLARMNPGLSIPVADGRRIVTADPVETARKVVPELEKKSDVVVALATLEPEQARSLAKQVQGIDLILGGYGAFLSANIDLVGETLVGKTRILYAGNQGKKVGEVRVFLGENAKIARAERELVNLGKRVPDDPGIMDLVERNRVAINELNKRQAPLVDAAKLRAMYEGSSYVRSEACKDCHEEAFRIWEETKHAHAFQILVERHQDYNPECVVCHTTGFRRPTGFVNAKSTPDLMNVQCEACHGPGKEHPEKVGEGYGPVGRQSCLICHTPDNSPDFDPVAYRVKIRHWKEDGRAAPAAVPAH